MPRERRKWTEAEDTILRDAVLKGGEGACDWHLIASCIPGRTNKDCRKRWHYKVAATVNKGPWEVAEDERLWASVQEHGSRWALVAQVVKTRNGDQCSKRWYDALDPSIDHSPWTPEEDVRLLEAIDKHGRNWKAIVKAYFPRRTSLSAKNRYSLLIRKMEPKKQSQSGTAKKTSTKPLPKPLPQQESLAFGGASGPRFHHEASSQTVEERPSRSQVSAAQSSSGSLGLLLGPSYQQYNTSNLDDSGRLSFESPLTSHKFTPDEAPYTSTPPECPPLSPTDWSGLTSTNATTSEASFPIATPPGSNEDMSLFFNDLHLNSRLSQGNLVSFSNAKYTERIVSHSLSLDQRNMSNITEVDFRRGGITPLSSSSRVDTNSSTAGDGGSANPRVVTVLINSEIPETVNRIVDQIGREAGVSIAIHLE